MLASHSHAVFSGPPRSQPFPVVEEISPTVQGPLSLICERTLCAIVLSTGGPERPFRRIKSRLHLRRGQAERGKIECACPQVSNMLFSAV